MTTAHVVFQKMIQDSQEYGSDDQHMVSRIFFSIQIDKDSPQNAYVNIKQTVGSDFETASLEVSKPNGYGGPFNYSAFREAAESYYRSLVGSTASGIRVAHGSTVRMQNNTFVKQAVVEFKVGKDGLGW